MKIIVSLLTLLTLIAVAIALFNFTPRQAVDIPSLTTSTSIVFIVAFMGWMPIPIDASVWHSIWTKEKTSQTGTPMTLNDASVDFNLGYIAASVIAVLFFMLGVLVMFGSGIKFSDSGVVFAGQLINLYTETLGQWTKPIIGCAAFITLFSTTLTVADAYPRVITEIFCLEGYSKTTSFRIYTYSLLVLILVALGIIIFGTDQFKLLVDIAAGLSFLSAPILAWFNFQLLQSKHIPKQFQFGYKFRIFSVLCLAGLILFSCVYIWSVIYPK